MKTMLTVGGIAALIDLFLLEGTAILCRKHTQFPRALSAAALGGVYASVCILPDFYFLGNIVWYLVFLCMRGALAYGISLNSIRQISFFTLLSMAMSGLASVIGGTDAPALLAACGILALVCFFASRHRLSAGCYVPVELVYGEKTLRLTALRDTGNMLRDPVSGKSVLVVGADIAGHLTGLTQAQLENPIDTMGYIPGLRLIPYHSIGQRGGFLLGLKIPKVRIDNWEGSAVVAFAPEIVGSKGTYQALTGGIA